MTIRIKIFVDRTKMIDDTYSIGPGSQLYISTFSGVPEGSTYRIRFIVRDTLSGQKSKGGFKKIIDCIKDPVTTTTLPPIDPNATTTTIGPGIDVT